MTWRDELSVMLHYSRGDAAIYCGLAALRCAENGGPGREMGVLSLPAPTFCDQVRIARNSFRNHEKRVFHQSATFPIRTPEGFYTEDFLRNFSKRWAPIGVANDPTDLNRHHATNLIAFYGRAVAHVRTAMLELRRPSIAAVDPAPPIET